MSTDPIQGTQQLFPATKAGAMHLQDDKVTAIIPNDLDTAAINPIKGARYSPNLYRWLTARNHPSRRWTSRVYTDSDGVLWIGFLSNSGAGTEFIGTRLIQVLCYGTKANTACWVRMGHMTEIKDFWTQYLADGRCAIDRQHKACFIGDDTRWRSLGATARECLWCGKARQALRRWIEPVQREAWGNVDAAPVAPAALEGTAP